MTAMMVEKKLGQNRGVVIGNYLSGESTRDIARRYGVSNASVWRFLDDNDIPIRSNKTTDERINTIELLYNNGLSPNAIEKHLGLGHGTAGRILRKLGYELPGNRRKREWSKDKEDIIGRYLAGNSTADLARVYGVERQIIRNHLVRWGVSVRGVRHHAYPVNEHFFDEIDSEKKAWCLGLMMADGYNRSKTGIVQLALTDHEMVRTFAEAIDWGGKCFTKPARKPTHKSQLCVSVGSRTMSDALTRLGCVQRKTYIAEFPSEEFVPDHLHRHMIRGWLDGDGCISGDKNRPNWWSVSIVGTEAVCRGISEASMKAIGVPGTLSIIRRKTYSPWVFAVGRKEHRELFCDWIYRDATVFLARKRDKYLAFLGRASYRNTEALVA